MLFFLGAVGGFNSLILSFYLFANKSYSNLSNKLFGLFLLILSLRVLKSLFYAFSTEEPIWFLQFGPSFFLLIGPLLFCYVVSVVNPNSFWVKYWKQHILVWLIIIAGLMIFVPFKDHSQLNKETILPIINLQWLLYMLVSYIFIRTNIDTKNNNSLKSKWLSFLLIAVLIIWASYTFITFNYFVSGSIVFSILFYLFFSVFIFKKKITSKIFEKTKQRSTITNSEKTDNLVSKLNTIMVDEKLFTNPDLKLSEVAKKLEISKHELSKLINDNIRKSFADFINEYRVEEAKKQIKTNSQYTIEAIGNQSGFNSKSAFYKAFKKFTGTTPARFKTQ